MNLSDLRKLIREEINDFDAPAMPRPAKLYKLKDDWEVNLDNVAVGDRQKANIKDKLAQYSPEDSFTAVDIFGGTGGYSNKLALLTTGNVIEPTGRKSLGGDEWEGPASSRIGTGRPQGRPSIVNHELKDMGARVIAKYSKGITEFDADEIKFIKDLAKSVIKKK